MCGRFVITSPPDAMRRLLRYREQPNFPARYNVAPTQPIPVVRLINGARTFTLMRWGLLPGWVKEPKGFTLLINARAETAAEKPAFRNALKRRRCLLPADGFYEWKREGALKQPYFIRRRDRAPFAFAGLWETWSGAGGEEIDTAAIVTTDASADIAGLHHRMPVTIDPDDFDAWLDDTSDAGVVQRLMRPAREGQFELFPVSDRVNKVINDDPRNVEPVAARSIPEKPEPKPDRKSDTPRPDDGQMSLF